MSTTYKFKAYYKTDGVGAAQDPAPVCTVINMADDSKLADAQATTASTNMPGLYTYSYTGNDGLDCVAYFHTTDADADEADVASYVSDKITTNLNADVAGVETKVDAILEDTGNTLDGLIKDVPTVSEFEARTKPAADYFDPTADTVANVTAVGTTTNLTNLPAMPADWLTAAGVKADAVTKLQANLALEATLTAIKGAGWTTESLKVIRDALTAVQADLDNPNQYKADVSGIPDALLAKVIVDTLTLKQVLKVLAAIEIGTTTGGGTASFTYTGKDGTTVQLTGVDENGNRTAVIVTPGA